MPRSSSRPLPRRRLVPPLLAVALVVAACGTTTTTATPSPAVPSTAPTAAPTTAPTSAPSSAPPATASEAPGSPAASEPAAGGCDPRDLVAASAGWESAAGSRLAEVAVANQGSTPCPVEGPTVAILDAAGNALLTSEPESGDPVDAVELAPGAEATFTLQFGNWCQASAAFPLQPVVVTGEGAGLRIDGLALASADDAPPCNGPGEEPVLMTGGWAG